MKGVLAEAAQRGHEQVVFFNYPQVGLKAIVAIHSTVLGPALGGCRMRPYADEAQAVEDVMRLAEGMTYKSSLAELDLGGGKACVIADPKVEEGREKLFRQFAECLNFLGGRYITAEDMGTSVKDVMCMREVTKFAAGFASERGGGGDPSPWTAKGVFQAMRAACERRYGSKNLKGRKVTVQGTGHVGMYLIELLTKEGARVTACDPNRESRERAAREFGAEIVEVDRIYDVSCEIYSPCAIGQTVNLDTIKRLRCDVIVGAANNQLIDAGVYGPLAERKILYCPDFVVNAGGVISCAAEYIEGGWSSSWVAEKVENIYRTTHRVLDEAEKRERFPEVVAVELAKERVERRRRG